MKIEELDDYWLIDIYPDKEIAYSKTINDIIADIGYENDEYFIKSVRYSKEKYSIEDILEKVKNLYLETGKDCPICSGLNRIKTISMSEKQVEKSNESNESNSNNISSSLLKILIDLPSKIFLTPMGRKVCNGFLLLLTNLLKDQSPKRERKSIEEFMDLLVQDLKIDEKELPYLYSNLTSVAKGIQNNDLSFISRALIKDPETTKKYLNALFPVQKEEKKKTFKERKKFI